MGYEFWPAVIGVIMGMLGAIHPRMASTGAIPATASGHAGLQHAWLV